MNNKMYDIIIIGAGPAGLSAAIYAARKKLNIIVLSGDIGSQANEAHIIENYLGLPEVAGSQFINDSISRVKGLGVSILEKHGVRKIIKKETHFEIQTIKNKFESRALIVATGKQYRKLDVPGAREFEGKGITYCATCDAPLFKGKTVAVIGAGDAGQDAAWQLTQYADKIYLLNRYPELRGDDKLMREKIKENPKIEIINESYPVEIKGEKFVEALVYQQNGSGEKNEIAVSGIFVEIGSAPVSEYLSDMVELNNKGEIIIDSQTNMTTCPGIFGAGDVTDVRHKQMIIAAGEGAKAALSAYEYLKQ